MHKIITCFSYLCMLYLLRFHTQFKKFSFVLNKSTFFLNAILWHQILVQPHMYVKPHNAFMKNFPFWKWFFVLRTATLDLRFSTYWLWHLYPLLQVSCMHMAWFSRNIIIGASNLTQHQPFVKQLDKDQACFVDIQNKTHIQNKNVFISFAIILWTASSPYATTILLFVDSC